MIHKKQKADSESAIFTKPK